MQPLTFFPRVPLRGCASLKCLSPVHIRRAWPFSKRRFVCFSFLCGIRQDRALLAFFGPWQSLYREPLRFGAPARAHYDRKRKFAMDKQLLFDGGPVQATAERASTKCGRFLPRAMRW